MRSILRVQWIERVINSRYRGWLLAALFMPFMWGCTTVDLNQTGGSGNGAGTAIDGGASSGLGPGGYNAVQSVDALGASAAETGPANVAHVLYFDLDSYTVQASDQAVIAAHARFLVQNTARSLILEGHTDEQGGREYNLALGQKRADAVANALRLLGVNTERLEAISFGEEKPEVAGQTQEAYAKNRRVVLRYR